MMNQIVVLLVLVIGLGLVPEELEEAGRFIGLGLVLVIGREVSLVYLLCSCNSLVFAASVFSILEIKYPRLSEQAASRAVDFLGYGKVSS